MIKSILSWRISRFFKKDGWRRLITHWDIWVSTVVVIICVWCLQSLQPTGTHHVDVACDVLSIVSLIGLLCSFINVIIGADDYYHIKTKNYNSSVYIYRRQHDTYKITVRKYQKTAGYFGTSMAKYIATKYDVLKYPRTIFVLFAAANKWYILLGAEGIELGTRVDTTLFCNDNSLNGKKVIFILSDNDVTSFQAEEFYFDDVKLAGMMAENQYNADRYIVIKNNGQYNVYGLYFKNKKSRPSIREVKQNVTFKRNVDVGSLTFNYGTNTYTLTT